MVSIKNKIIRAIEDFNMLIEDSNVLIAVSGGSDSMCLLHFFIEYYKDKNNNIIVAHVNYNLRGDDSNKDEDIVRNFCKNNNIKLFVKHCKAKEEAKKLHIGIEEYARNVRYSFFKELCNNNNIKIATAHNLDDNAETVIFNLVRGSALKGLCGIPPVRDNIIRPLIYVSKEETIKYCNEYGINFASDYTNTLNNFNRNKIRNLVMPVLKEINPNCENTILRTTKIIREDDNYLMNKANSIVKSLKVEGGFDAKKINELDNAIKKRVIITIAKGIQLENIHIIAIINELKKENSVINLPNKYNAVIKNSVFYISKHKYNSEYKNWQIKFKYENIVLPTGEKLLIKQLNEEEINNILKNDKTQFKFLINCDIINNYTVFRNRLKGDKFKPVGRSVTKTYKKLMQENGILPDERNKIVMLCNKDEILWINGIGVSEQAKVKNNKKAILILPED